MLLALAAAVALHEIVAGLWPSHEQPKPEERVVTQLVSVARRTPAPTPAPTPRLTPTPRPAPTPTPQPHYTVAPKVVVRVAAPKAAATPSRRLGGAAAPKHLVRATPAPRPVIARASTQPLAAGTAAGHQGGGAGTGAGSGTGTGGLGGTGTGSGTAGNGNAGDVASAPCGDVFLLPGHLSYRRDGTVLQEVLAKVVTRDGTVSIGLFPWPFLYPGEQQNPFVHDEALNGHNGVPVQQPPPGTDVAALPPAVQVVLKHTDPATGTTTLPECTRSGA